ncbi:MAG: glutamate--tRNA ligase [Pseudomonadota bacterium]
MQTGQPKLRFAPSPTGLLHPGNARIAVLNWLFASHHNGRFLLRIDDTDRERSTAAYEQAIRNDLAWLGLSYDDSFRQSDRMRFYQDAMKQLQDIGRLYPCYETAQELKLKRKIQLAQGKPPRYDRAALDCSRADLDRFAAEGRKPHWRFKLDHDAIIWEDLVRGSVQFDAAQISDPVLVREDGRPLYSLTSVVDDGHGKITHIVRGEDHVTNTAVQIQIFTALGFAIPDFAHLPLLTAGDGANLSKRDGSFSLADLRTQEIEAPALLAMLAKLGTGSQVTGLETIAELQQDCSFARFGLASARFDLAQLRLASTRCLRAQSFADLQHTMPDLADSDAALFDLVRGNLEKKSDIAFWRQRLSADRANAPVEWPIEWVIDQSVRKTVLQAALDHLPDEIPDIDAARSWMQASCTQAGIAGRVFFMTVRLALTGVQYGPELPLLAVFLGHTNIARRLHQAIND